MTSAGCSSTADLRTVYNDQFHREPASRSKGVYGVFYRYARRGRPGVAKVRHVLEQYGPGFAVPESALEERTLDLLRAAGLPAAGRTGDARLLGPAAGPGRLRLRRGAHRHRGGRPTRSTARRCSSPIGSGTTQPASPAGGYSGSPGRSVTERPDVRPGDHRRAPSRRPIARSPDQPAADPAPQRSVSAAGSIAARPQARRAARAVTGCGLGRRGRVGVGRPTPGRPDWRWKARGAPPLSSIGRRTRLRATYHRVKHNRRLRRPRGNRAAQSGRAPPGFALRSARVKDHRATWPRKRSSARRSA